MWIKKFKKFNENILNLSDFTGKLKFSDFTIYNIGDRFKKPDTNITFQIIGRGKTTYTLKWRVSNATRTETIPQKDIHLYDDYIKMGIPYKKESLINESLSIWYDSLLSSIDAQEVNIQDTLKLTKKIKNTDLDYFNNNEDFISSLSSIGLKKSNMENTEDYETFMNTPCRFMFIYDIKSNELENPLYLMLQVYDNSLNKWQNTKCYKINDDIKKFYDKLSSKIIEITDGNDKFIYETSDKNTWDLKSVKETDIYKRSFRKEDLEKIIRDRKVKIKII